MENQAQKQQREEKEMQIFSHQERPHYSYKGYFISCKEYAFQKSLNKDRDEIMFEKAKSFKMLFHEQDNIEAEKPRARIENISQLMQYIAKECLNENEKEKLIKIYKKEMTIDEKIKLFPEIYQAVLRMYKECKLKRERGSKIDKKKEVESLTKTLTGTMSADYNPDAFIEVDNG